MMTFARTTLMLLTAATTLAACGHAMPGARLPHAAGFHALDDAAPQPVRRRGYDRDRYRDVIAPAEKPVTMPRQGLLPTRVDHRRECPPIYDQGDLGACTAFAIAKGLREHAQTRRGGQPVPQSALFFYYAERQLMGTTGKDSGATIADGMKVITRTGSAPEVFWPYDIAKFAARPPAHAYAEAPKWKLRKSYHLASFEDVKTSLARGYTVAMGFATYPSFDKIGKGGMMPMPGAKEKSDGGHACLAVGYDEQKKVLIVRNSYGARWGDDGCFYMPYAFAADRKQVDEYWTAD